MNTSTHLSIILYLSEMFPQAGLRRYVIPSAWFRQACRAFGQNDVPGSSLEGDGEGGQGLQAEVVGPPTHSLCIYQKNLYSKCFASTALSLETCL